jgi:broad specificity phosphatase PhoE
MKQSKNTGKYLNDYRQQDLNFDLVLCSPMLRTKKTAEIICKELHYDFNKVKYMDELIERDQGLISIGKTHDELKKDNFYDDYFTKGDTILFIKDPILLNKEWNLFLNTYCNKKYEYETEKHILNRLEIVVNLLKKTKFKKILIITHGGTIHELIKLLFNISDITGNYKFGSNCHITYIIYNKKQFYLEYGPSTLHLGIYNKN